MYSIRLATQSDYLNIIELNLEKGLCVREQTETLLNCIKLAEAIAIAEIDTHLVCCLFLFKRENKFGWVTNLVKSNTALGQKGLISSIFRFIFLEAYERGFALLGGFAIDERAANIYKFLGSAEVNPQEWLIFLPALLALNQELNFPVTAVFENGTFHYQNGENNLFLDLKRRVAKTMSDQSFSISAAEWQNLEDYLIQNSNKCYVSISGEDAQMISLRAYPIKSSEVDFCMPVGDLSLKCSVISETISIFKNDLGLVKIEVFSEPAGYRIGFSTNSGLPIRIEFRKNGQKEDKQLGITSSTAVNWTAKTLGSVKCTFVNFLAETGECFVTTKGS